MAQYDLLLTQNVHATLTEYSEKFVNISKGGLLSADTSKTPTVLAAGTTGYVLVRDDAETTGLKWVDPSTLLSGVTVANQANDRIVTATATSNALNAEQYLTYNTTQGLQIALGAGILFPANAGTWQIYTANGAVTANIEISTGTNSAGGAGSVTVKAGAGTSAGGNVYLQRDTTYGNIYFGTGATGHLPAKSSETNVVFYDSATGKLTYGASVLMSGTAADNQVAVWTGTNSIEGSSALTFDGTALATTAYISQTTNADLRVGTTKVLHLNPTDQNIRIGINAGNETMTQTYPQVLIGSSAGYNLGASNGNVIIGYLAGQLMGTGAYNVAIGIYALNRITAGAQSVAIGAQALRNNTGSGNLAIGYAAGMGTSGSSTGGSNVFIGASSGGVVTTGAANVFIGNSAGLRATTGGNNMYLGASAGAYNLGSWNVCIGTYAGRGVDGSTDAGYNIFIGPYTGADVTTGTYNIAIGYDVEPSSITASYELRIGRGSTILVNGSTASGSEWVGTDYVFKSDTINEYTAAAGVTIEGVLMKDNDVFVSSTNKLHFYDATSLYFAAQNASVFDLYLNSTLKFQFLQGTSSAYFKFYLDSATDQYGYIHASTSGYDINYTAGPRSNSAGMSVMVQGGDAVTATYNGGTLYLKGGTAGAGGTNGVVNVLSALTLSGIASATASNMLYYNAGVITYGAAPTGGTGYVTISGTPVDNQIAVWKTSSSIEGTDMFTFSDTGNLIVGNSSTAGTLWVGVGASNSNEGVYISEDILRINIAGNGRCFLNPSIADSGGGTSAYNFDTSVALTTTNIVKFAANGTARFYMTGSGAVYMPSIGTATTSYVLFYNTTSGLITYGAAPSGGGVTLSGSTDNTVCTVTGANAIQGEANLTFSGTTFALTGPGTFDVTGKINLLTDGVYVTETPSNQTATGMKVTVTAGETLAFGNVCYIKSSDGRAWRADANATSAYPVVGMAMGSATAGNSITLLLNGIARGDTEWAWTVGGVIYLSATTGAMTQTAPTGSGTRVQVLGVATHADRMYFAPSLDMITLSS